MYTRLATIGMASLCAMSTAQADLIGPYAFDNWSTTGIQDGTTAIYPAPLEALDLVYEVNLGNPGTGVDETGATWSAPAPRDPDQASPNRRAEGAARRWRGRLCLLFAPGFSARAFEPQVRRPGLDPGPHPQRPRVKPGAGIP